MARCGIQRLTSPTTTSSYKLDLHTQPSAEAQVAAIADDVAYHSHDLDDGLRARLFAVDDLKHLPLVGESLAAARMSSLDVPPPRLRHEMLRRVINAMVTDLIAEIRAAAGEAGSRQPGRDPPAQAAGGQLQSGDGRRQPGDQGFPVRPHVPPLAGQPHVGQGQAADRGAVSGCCMPTPLCCPMTGAPGPATAGCSVRPPSSGITWRA